MIAGVLLCAASAWAQGNAVAEKQLIANERMITEAVNKKDLKMFHMMVDPSGIGVDGLGFTRVSDMDKMFQQMNITESRIDQERVTWLSPDVAVVAYRWTGKGTFQGMPVPSPTYASTIYVKQKNGDWIAKFHQESMAMPAPPAAPPAARPPVRK
jgi:ketosteroid isomerase-like protein